MELIIIDESRLKIMLTPADMRHYALPSEHMSAVGSATRRAFRHIFDDARERVGFDTAGERLFVQLYTSRGGGCEIFVTKLGEAEELADILGEEALDELCAPDDLPDALLGEMTDEERLSHGEKALLDRLQADGASRCTTPCTEPYPASRTAAKAETATPARRFAPTPRLVGAAYRFAEAEVLFALCRRLLATGYRGESSVYIDEHERWYLLLSPAGGTPLPFLTEYAPSFPDTESLALWLSEHGRAICAEAAVEVLGRV